ncbi:hypothetical protein TCAL_17201 [Tigriopus californicus]|uniref:CCHC-type domain-containing protein n=1 Tax=Tigriopus californicus TaxID=6832 RepID=A0A553N8J4_TIGCA|nr:hypothetical protein TCAL_17201 [Tigriopus californicus]
MANARDLVRPETFKAESQTLDDYLDYFESVVGVNEWADAKAAGVLICCLGVGSRLLDDVGAADRGSFATLKASLRNSKAPHRLVEAGELKFMRKGASETPQDFRSRVARKVDVCYGDFAASKKKVLVLDNFVYGLPMEMRNAVLLHHPSKIEDAVTAAMMFDTIRPFNASNKGKPKVLSEPVKNAPFKANDSRESGGNVTNWNTVTCYKCQERGHKASECRNKRRSHVSVIRPVARENIKKSQEKSKKNYDKAYHVEATPVTEKNFVMWLRPAPVARGGSQKLKPPFQGPYLVESVSDKTARISDQTGRCQSVNVDQLKITKVDDPHLGVLRKRGRPRKSGGGM